MIERDVAELRARVAQLEGQVAFLARHLGVALPSHRPAGVSDRVIELVRAGNKLAAIKAHIDETGLDMVAAKRVIDAIE